MEYQEAVMVELYKTFIFSIFSALQVKWWNSNAGILMRILTRKKNSTIRANIECTKIIAIVNTYTGKWSTQNIRQHCKYFVYCEKQNKCFVRIRAANSTHWTNAVYIRLFGGFTRFPFFWLVWSVSAASTQPQICVSLWQCKSKKSSITSKYKNCSWEKFKISFLINVPSFLVLRRCIIPFRLIQVILWWKNNDCSREYFSVFQYFPPMTSSINLLHFCNVKKRSKIGSSRLAEHYVRPFI